MFLIDMEKVNAQVGIGEALLNTVIAMATVFIVLILISIIIFLLKYVPKLFDRKKTEQAVKPEPPAKKEVPVVAQKPAANNDTQIVAVIMAAIASQMETETGVPVPADGLVIRSIKKRTFTK